jgi:hypothetical protein
LRLDLHGVLQAKEATEPAPVMLGFVARGSIEPTPHPGAGHELLALAVRDHEDLLHDVLDVRSAARQSLDDAQQKRRVLHEQRGDVDLGGSRGREGARERGARHA